MGDRQSIVVDIKEIFLSSYGRVPHEIGGIQILEIVIELLSVRVWYFVDQSQEVRVFERPRLRGEIRQGHRYYVYLLL